MHCVCCPAHSLAEWCHHCLLWADFFTIIHGGSGVRAQPCTQDWGWRRGSSSFFTHHFCLPLSNSCLHIVCFGYMLPTSFAGVWWGGDLRKAEGTERGTVQSELITFEVRKEKGPRVGAQSCTTAIEKSTRQPKQSRDIKSLSRTWSRSKLRSISFLNCSNSSRVYSVAFLPSTAFSYSAALTHPALHSMIACTLTSFRPFP